MPSVLARSESGENLQRGIWYCSVEANGKSQSEPIQAHNRRNEVALQQAQPKPDMIEFEQEEFGDLRAKIKVIGVGGAGGNAVKRMIEAGLAGIEFYAVNTDHQALKTCHGATQLQIGINTTHGLGAGANPDVGRKAAEEDREHLEKIVEDANMVFVTAGMGGGTGTGAAPLIASLARERGALTIGVVTRPFNFEGMRRAEQAEDGLQELRSSADSVIIVPNQRLMDAMDRKLPIQEALRVGDQILLHGVQSISDIITEAGEINVDFADVESIMRDAGSALMGMGRATGDNRAQIAAQQAISSPLLEETDITGAYGMIVNITSPPDFMMHELDEAMQVIQEAATDAQIIFGLVYKDAMELGDEVLVTVIATGFDTEELRNDTRVSSGSRQYSEPEAYAEPRRAPVPGSHLPGSRQGKAAPSRTRPGRAAPAPPAAEPTPARARRAAPAAEEPAARRASRSSRGETDWDIPAFLRVQKGGSGNTKK